jgi:LysM repeat protein
MFWRLIAAGVCLLPGLLFSQANPDTVRLANLEQDVRALQQTMNTLRLEFEEMARENARLRAQVQQEVTNSRRDLVTLQQLNQRLSALSRDVEGSLATSQKATIDEVAKRMETLAKQTQEAIKALSDAIGQRPQLAPTFNTNFPKTGVSYTVQPGDSLGKIAREHNSTIDWIRNANAIAGDRIFPNQQLFIPQQN